MALRSSSSSSLRTRYTQIASIRGPAHAHHIAQDSLNYLLPFYRAPGADDDGSGSVTILQVLRSLVEEGFVPPAGIAVEVHWFAAEEGGLLGSQAVAAAYEKAGTRVKGMLHMDSAPCSHSHL